MSDPWIRLDAARRKLRELLLSGGAGNFPEDIQQLDDEIKILEAEVKKCERAHKIAESKKLRKDWGSPFA